MGSGGSGGSMLRSSPGQDFAGGPSLAHFILHPWLISVILLLVSFLSAGRSWFWVIVPSILVCAITMSSAIKVHKMGDNATAIYHILCFIAAFAAFVVSVITYVHFLRPYNHLGKGATYLDLLPSQSAAGASDATAIMFAEGTGVDISRAYGYVDARSPEGNIYCVAPVSNKYTIAEPGVQFFSAGINCCGKNTKDLGSGEESTTSTTLAPGAASKDESTFGCGEGGSGARGALILALEESAEDGYKYAVEGAAVAYNLQPGTGYLLLNMVADPVEYRNDKWSGAAKLLLVYVFVYLIISCMAGYMGFNVATKRL
jgi:hypothetical protein